MTTIDKPKKAANGHTRMVGPTRLKAQRLSKKIKMKHKASVAFLTVHPMGLHAGSLSTAS